MRCYFIDSNILVYANDRNAGEKQDRAIEVIKRCMKAGNGVISLQVLQEYAIIALTKLMQDAAVVLRQLTLLDVFRIIAPSSAMVRRGVEIRSAYRISFWDAGIVAAGENAECDCILSEDLNTGQFYAGVKVTSPFAPGFDPAELNK